MLLSYIDSRLGKKSKLQADCLSLLDQLGGIGNSLGCQQVQPTELIERQCQ
jgi:hypothetical protein